MTEDIKYRISFLPEGFDKPVILGKLLLNKEHKVKAKAAHPDYAEAMAELEKEINEMPVLHLPDAPPNASPLESWVKIIERGDDEFPAALKTILTDNFDLIVSD